MPQMPGLTDKAFLPISIFVLNVVLAIFRIILVSAVGACFVIYARYGGEYANSVRWIRSVGYLEMFQTLRSTKNKHVPGSVKRALVLGIIVTLAASLLDKGIAAFITPATRNGTPDRVVLNSTQPSIFGDIGYFLGWKLSVPDKGNVTEIMRKALISTALPDPKDGYDYNPVELDYNATCNNSGIRVGGTVLRSACMTVLPFPEDSFKTLFTTTNQADNRYLITLQKGAQPYLSLPLEWKFTYGTAGDNEYCVVTEDYQKPLNSVGFAVPLRTSTTKCFFFERENVAVVAMTTARFSPNSVYNATEVQDYLAEGSNELLVAMDEAINKPSPAPGRPGQPQNGTTVGMWAVIRATNTTIDFYACEYFDSSFECVYAVGSSILFHQPFENLKNATDNDLRERRRDRYMTLEYFMSAYNVTPVDTDDDVRWKLRSVSIEKMRNDTLAVADYMAQLGSSLHADFHNMKLYVQYDIAKINSGFEVPFWVLVVAGILLVVSLLSWQMTNWLIGSPYNSSLYSVIRSRLSSRSNTSISKIMRFRFEPLMFEDVKLLPDHVEYSSNEEHMPGDDKDHTNPSTV
ncbi:MAG: hypothetical protein J3Q66DRAFT_321073 [Benniella sp.]|nr:MAG: hypothetical protein J3Q66DRAFT_321073 [Benniella sp.]